MLYRPAEMAWSHAYWLIAIDNNMHLQNIRQQKKHDQMLANWDGLLNCM